MRKKERKKSLKIEKERKKIRRDGERKNERERNTNKLSK